MDPNVDPRIYPLFYPYGTQGCHRNIPQIGRKARVSPGEYIKFRLALRANEFNGFLLGRRLFQQWIVDNYQSRKR